MISLEEVDERAFLFVGERCLDMNVVGCVGGVNWYLLRVFGGLESAGATFGSIQGTLGQPSKARPIPWSRLAMRQAHGRLPHMYRRS